MKKSISLIFILLFTLNMSMSAEDVGLRYQNLLPDFTQMTPEAASLGNYGTIGASEYTGVPDIKIPLFSVNSGKTSVPLYLYYDASGIKVEQEATYVGLGWNLSYGGYITHIVCGKDDFLRSPYTRTEEYQRLTDSLLFRSRNDSWSKSIGDDVNKLSPLFMEVSLMINWGLLSVGGDGSFSAGKRYKTEDDEKINDLLNEIAEGYFVPDIFQANFCGHSVNFLFDNETKEVVILNDDEKKYKIECFQKEGSFRWPYEITITDDNGTIYRFAAYCEYGNNDDSYFLESITDITGENWVKYDYSYRNDNKQQCSLGSYYQSIGKAVQDGCNTVTDRVKSQFMEKHTSWTFNTAVMNKLYPRKIETPQETVNFEYEERTDVLNSLRIKSITSFSKNGNSQLHKINLDYGRFEEKYYGKLSTTVTPGTSYNIPRERLKLTGIKVDEKEYRFAYDESEPLPYRTALAQDYWGYYNGIENGDDFCATPKFKLEKDSLKEVDYVGEANRNCSFKHCKAGILNKIYYPTGGYSEFEYEINHFDDPCDNYYTEAEYFQRKTTYTEVITLGSTAVNAGADNSKGIEIRRDTIILKEPKKVSVQYGLHRENTSEYVYVKFEGPSASLYYSLNSPDKVLQGSTELELEPGMYTMVAYAMATSQTPPHYNTVAAVSVTYDRLRKIPLDYVDLSDGSGSSVGGGLRIKSIKNYGGDKENDFLGGTEYKYQGGALLIPTAYAKRMGIDEIEVKKVLTELGWHVSYNDRHSEFYYTGSQSPYPPYCSLGSPTVGYSAVTKQTINPDGTKGDRTITSFHNAGYSLLGNISQFYHANHGLNGKTKEVCVVSSVGDTLSKTQYDYGRKLGKRVFFPNCQKNYIWGISLDPQRFSYSVFCKTNVWNYLSKQVETQYVNGKPMTPIETTYSYNAENYQPSQTIRKQGPVASEQLLYYPSDGKSVGCDYLTNKHCIGKLTGERNYLNGKLTGGARLDFRLHANAPVVDKFYSVLPDETLSLELNVVKYDDHGNILEYVTKNGTHTTILWSYNYQYPVMQIVGATYEQVCRVTDVAARLGSRSTLSMDELRPLYYKIKDSDLNAQVSAYTYDQWYGVSDIITPGGKPMHYGRDSQGRLKEILEESQSGAVVQRFFYHYRNQ